MEQTEQIKISVIMPIYNGQQHLAEALEHVLMQTITPIEIICVDDGSTDDTSNILQAYAQQYKQIKVITQQNAGAGLARNNGLKSAKGKYIAFMDADDKYPHVDTLELLYRKAEVNHVHIAGGSFSDFSAYEVNCRYGGVMSAYTFRQEGLMKYEDYQFDYGFTRFIYEREFLLENELWFASYKRYEDPPFFVRAMIKSKTFYAIPDITYCYRVAHKAASWDIEKANDFITGLLDNLIYANEHELDYLYWLILKRIQGEAKDVIYAACCKQNVLMKSMLKKLQSLLIRDKLPLCDKLFLYHDMQHFIVRGLKYCERYTEPRKVSKWMDVKRVLNGSYITLYGVRHTARKFVQKAKMSRYVE